MRSVRINTAAGFTLIELLMGIVILAILLAGALPAFMTFVANNRLDSQANEIVAATQLARSEAINRGVPVTICSSSNAASCGGGFADGWIVIANEGTGNDTLVQTWPAPDSDIAFTPAAGRVDFLPTGFADANAVQTLLMELDNCSNDNQRRIEVEVTGRVASRRVACP